MTIKFNNIMKISSLSLVLYFGTISSIYAHSFFITHEPASSLTLVKSEWRDGQDNIALGNRLIRKGEFDTASGRPIVGRDEIAQGRDLKAQGREEVNDSHYAKEWVRKGRPFYRW